MHTYIHTYIHTQVGILDHRLNKHMLASIRCMYEEQGGIEPDPQAISNVLHALAVLNIRGRDVDDVFEHALPALLKVE